jgi:phosphate transport system substrate-binding protein
MSVEEPHSTYIFCAFSGHRGFSGASVSYFIPHPKIVVTFLWIVFFGVVACAPAANGSGTTPTIAPQQTMNVSGSGTVTSVLESIKSTFETEHPEVILNILESLGTTGGVEGVVNGTLDVAAMARAPRAEESEQGLEYVEFGQAGVAFIVHPDNPVQGLTQAQVKAIFAGEITNWSEVGGNDSAIVLLVRDEDESATQALRDVMFGDTPFPATAAVMVSSGEMVIGIEGTTNGIGFGNLPGIRSRDSEVVPLAIDGVLPSESNYAVLTPLGLGYLKAQETSVKVLVDWVQSESGQAALGEYDVILPTP